MKVFFELAIKTNDERSMCQLSRVLCFIIIFAQPSLMEHPVENNGSTPSLFSFQQHQQISSPTSPLNTNENPNQNIYNQQQNNVQNNLTPNLIIQNNLNTNVTNNSVVFMSPLQAKVEKLFSSFESKLQSFSVNTANPTDHRRDQNDKSSDLVSFCNKIKKVKKKNWLLFYYF